MMPATSVVFLSVGTMRVCLAQRPLTCISVAEMTSLVSGLTISALMSSVSGVPKSASLVVISVVVHVPSAAAVTVCGVKSCDMSRKRTLL